MVPQQWIDSVDWEVSEKGGFQNGTINIKAQWQSLSFLGTEHVDIWWNGIRVYRGFIYLHEPNLTIPEQFTITTYGLQEKLNGYIILKCLCYGSAVDISQIFTDILNAYVLRTNRLPNLVVDCSAIPALGIMVQSFCAKNKSATQAFNQLMDVAPNQLVWGCDIDSNGKDRIYLRPRSTSVKYKFAVGDRVQSLTFPRDVTQVVNIVNVTGGTVDQKNIAPNPSFEECQPSGALTSNLLSNSGFESVSGSNFTSWVRSYDPTPAGGFGRGGTMAVDFDNNPNAPEIVAQTVGYNPGTILSASIWVRGVIGSTGPPAQIVIGIVVSDSGSTAGHVFAFYSAPITIPYDNIYHNYIFTMPYAPPDPTLANAQVMFICQSAPTNGYNIDDAALWSSGVSASKWVIGTNSGAYYAQLNWQRMNNGIINAYDGDVCVQAQATITGGGGSYAELTTATSNRVQVYAIQSYVLIVWFYALTSNASVGIGVNQWQDSTHTGYNVFPQVATAGQWTQASFSFTPTGSTNGVDIVIRLYDNNPVLIDAVGLYQGNTPPTDYYTADTYNSRRKVSDYTAAQIGTAQAASITTYGEREKVESNVSIVDRTTLDLFCTGYLQSHAIPVVQGRLTLIDPAGVVNPDGTIQIENLPSAPEPAFPSRMRYQFNSDGQVKLDIDLNNERPDLALLLRKTVSGTSL